MPLSRSLRLTGLTLLLATLAIGPFLRGLFNWTELLGAITLIAAGFGLWLVGRRLGDLPTGVPCGDTGLALLGLLLAYLVQFAWAVYARGNLDWVLRAAAAWAVYVMVRAEAGPALRRWLGWTFGLSSIAVALLGFFAFTGDASQERMYTLFQYPNTAAAFFLAAALVLAGLALQELRPWKLTLMGGLLTLLNLAFFFTASRGALVVLPFALLLLYVGLDRQRRWPAFLLLLTSLLPMLPVLKGIGTYAAAQNRVGAFLLIGAATAMGLLGGFIVELFMCLKQSYQCALVGTGLAVVVAALLLFRPAGGLLPPQAHRLLDRNAATQSLVLRLAYNQDAARLVMNQPEGYGGWGWDRTYRLYQMFNYTAEQTHNHYAQTAVEAGLPGLMALVLALATALRDAWARRRGDPLGWSLAAGAALIAGHSLVDFDLSFGLIWLLLWSLLAASAAPVAKSKWEKIGSLGALATTAGAAVFAALLTLGAWYADRAEALAGQQQPEAAKVMAARSLRFDPWNTEPMRIVGDRATLERAAALDPNNAGIWTDLTLLREQQQDDSGAFEAANRALGSHPAAPDSYGKVASMLGTMMVDALRDGDRDEAVRRAQHLMMLGGEFIARKEATAPLQHLSEGPPMTMTPEFKLRYGQALYLRGDLVQAANYLHGSNDADLSNEEADLWLYAIYQKCGDTRAMAKLEQKPWIRSRSENPVFQAILTWQ